MAKISRLLPWVNLNKCSTDKKFVLFVFLCYSVLKDRAKLKGRFREFQESAKFKKLVESEPSYKQ